MPIKVFTAPAIEPVTLAEAKTHCRIASEVDDAGVTARILAAREHVEQLLGRALITQTLDWSLDGFDGVALKWVPRAPLQSVTSITYLDAAGALQTLASSVYRVDAVSEPGRIVLGVAQSWPATYDVPNAVTVRFVAGYGDTSRSVPQSIRSAMLIFIAELDEQRAISLVALSVAEARAFKALLALHRIYGFAA